MRNVFPPQMSIGQRDIADIQIDVSSRDDIPVILLGLQHIFTTQPLRDAVFKILEEVAPTKMDDEGTKIVSINKGRPGMDQWSILVLGSLRVGLNTDYVPSPANQTDLKTLIEQVVLPKKGKLSKADQEREYAPEFKPAKKQHSAVESAINALEVHGLDKCLDHGIDAFERYVGLAVLSRNIQKLGTIKRDMERLQILEKRQKLAA